MEDGVTPGIGGAGLAKAISVQKTQGRLKHKHKMVVSAHMEHKTIYPGDKPTYDWRDEQLKRLQSEMKAIEKELASWDDVSAGKKVRKSLEAEHAIKKAKIQLHKAGGEVY